MKGLVFTELLSMADEHVGEDGVDQVLSRCPLSSGGAYTAVGNYPSEELTTLVGAFSDATQLDIGQYQRMFGRWMFGTFLDSYPHFFENKATAFDMLDSVEEEVHVDVRKLYPDAELPVFETEHLDATKMVFIYTSPRGLVDFCHGLIQACLDHYGETADIQVEVSRSDKLTTARFDITRLS